MARNACIKEVYHTRFLHMTPLGAQVANHLSFGREDTDDDKVSALGEVVAVGDPVWVKVVEVQQDDRGPKVNLSPVYPS